MIPQNKLSKFARGAPLCDIIGIESRNTPSTTNLVDEEIVDCLGNDGNASMQERVKRPNPWRNDDGDDENHGRTIIKYARIA